MHGSSTSRASASEMDARVFDVARFGASTDGSADSTAALQAAIDAAAKVARSANCAHNLLCPPRPIVRIAAGATVVSRAVALRSGMVREIDGRLRSAHGDAVLKSWPTLPALPTYGRDRDGAKRRRFAALVRAEGARDVAIRGRGVIDGRGPWWWERKKSLRHGRPHLVEFYNCSDVEVSGVELRDSAFWTLHPVYSHRVHVHHTTIRAPLYAPNADGIDPDSCRDVVIEHNDISCGDDWVAIKAGLNAYARTSFPRFVTQNVTVRHNTLRTGMGISVGSETAGGIRDVRVHDNLVLGDGGWAVALHVKTAPSRGNMVERVSFRRNVVRNTTGFMRLEGLYQVNGPGERPDGYAPTRVRDLEWVGNSYGPAERRTRAAFICSAAAPCKRITVANNTMGPTSRWSCAHIAHATVGGNSPKGLRGCMRRSKKAAPRQKRRGAFRQFNWRKGAVERKE